MGLRLPELVGVRRIPLGLHGILFLLDLRNGIVKRDRKRIMRTAVVVENIVAIVVVAAVAVVDDEYLVAMIHRSNVFVYFRIVKMIEYSGFQVDFRPSVYFINSAREYKTGP